MTRVIRRTWLVYCLALGLSACGSEPLGGDVGVEDTISEVAPTCDVTLPYADEVVSFVPGEGAGYGEESMPEVVLGPPTPGPPESGSLDVLSLGVGGEIVLGFSGRAIVDGPGPDFIVWENVFWVGGDRTAPFVELGEVSVSDDGVRWVTFPCGVSGRDGVYDTGCAGWRPRRDFDPCEQVPLDAAQVGGDAFDLSEVGLERARYIRIRDLSEDGVAPSAGFDLDAVGAINLE